MVDVDTETVDMEKIVNLSLSVLLVLWGCALGGSPSVQIGMSFSVCLFVCLLNMYILNKIKVVIFYRTMRKVRLMPLYT